MGSTDVIRAGVICLMLVWVASHAGGDRAELGRSPIWWTTHALTKVRPHDAAPVQSPGGVRIAAARNEFEPFQLVLRARSASLRGVDVELGDLVGERGGGRIASRWSTVYRERYLVLDQPSSIAGSAGEWPDPLIPRIDTYHGEPRSAFPFDLRADRNQPLWIELYVPPDTQPDRYHGELRVTAEGRSVLEVPVSLRVWSFSLPSTSSLRSSFGLSGPALVAQHLGEYTSDDDLFRLTRIYSVAALRHRLSLHGGSMVPPPARFDGARVAVDWSELDREMAPLLDGTVFGASDYLPGARFTSIDVTTPPGLAPEQKLVYWREWARHFRERGWLDRLFLYVLDEPQNREDLEEANRIGRLAKASDPELRTLLTEQLVPELTGAVDLWVPLVNCMEDRPDGERYCEENVPRERYRQAEQRGAQVWWYQSCASHGCGGQGGAAYTGWPSYAIDESPVAHRIMPWLAWRYRIAGELYYNTVESYLGEGADPWNDVRLHGGNGDGSLFYPGAPARIGGTTDIPIESIRLKLVREGMEDYEYLALAARSGLGDVAQRLARRIASGTYNWDRRPHALYDARQALAFALDERARAEARRGR
jgi:hypothetical protein